jgi:hypothetical protein
MIDEFPGNWNSTRLGTAQQIFLLSLAVGVLVFFSSDFIVEARFGITSWSRYSGAGFGDVLMVDVLACWVIAEAVLVRTQA